VCTDSEEQALGSKSQTQNRGGLTLSLTLLVDKYKLVGPIYDWLSAFYSGKSIHDARSRCSTGCDRAAQPEVEAAPQPAVPPALAQPEVAG
jgi:hypothetical protein